MTDKEIFEDLKQVLTQEFEVEDKTISLEASFYDDMGLDSLDAIDLVVRISDKYDIDLSNKTIENTKTLAQLVDAVSDKLNR